MISKKLHLYLEFKLQKTTTMIKELNISEQEKYKSECHQKVAESLELFSKIFKSLANEADFSLSMHKQGFKTQLMEAIELSLDEKGEISFAKLLHSITKERLIANKDLLHKAYRIQNDENINLYYVFLKDDTSENRRRICKHTQIVDLVPEFRDNTDIVIHIVPPDLEELFMTTELPANEGKYEQII
jgi:hypothetical protein